jgi:hypothetical protein
MLRFVTSTLTASVLAGTMSVLAQGAAPPQADGPQAQPQPQAQAQPQAQPAKETLTGCVMEAKTTDGGKAYVLNEAEGGTAKMYVLVASSSPSAVGTAGTGTTAATGTTGTSVDANVNKKVEVTGSVFQPTPPAANAPAADPKVLRPPTVRVDSVKVVSDSCK